MSRLPNKPVTPEKGEPLPPAVGIVTVQMKRWMALIVLIYLACASTHAYVTPLQVSKPGEHVETQNFINAPDEEAHLQYVRAMSHLRFPDRKETYEWHQPPVYYLLAAAPFLASPYAVRGLSILVGLLSLWLIFRIVREMFPEDAWLAVLGMGLVALLPMRQATTAMAGNDGILELAIGAALLLMVQTLRGGLTTTRGAAIGIAIGMAVLIKLSAIILIPLALLLLYLLWKAGERTPMLAKGTGWAFLAIVIIVAPWMVRMSIVTGAPIPLKTFKEDFVNTSKADDWIGKNSVSIDHMTGKLSAGPTMTRLGYMELLSDWTYRTFVASYTPAGRDASVGRPVFLTPQFYLLPLLIAIVALIGWINLFLQRTTQLTMLQRQMAVLLIALVCLVCLSFAGFTWTYFQAQGRYLYPALPAMACLFAIGLRKAMPERYAGVVCAGSLVLLALLDIAFLTSGVLPAYRG